MARQIPMSAGAVYVLTSGSGSLVKIGMVSHGQAPGRCLQKATQRAKDYARECRLYTTFHVFAVIPADDPAAVEAAAHEALAHVRVPRTGGRGRARELFRIDPETARRVVEASAASIAATMLNRWRRPPVIGEGFVMYA